MALRLKTFVFWPLVMLILINAVWVFEDRVSAISLLLFAAFIWVMFFRAFRSQIYMWNYRGRHCEELFFRRQDWIFRPIHVWRSRCINCKKSLQIESVH